MSEVNPVDSNVGENVGGNAESSEKKKAVKKSQVRKVKSKTASSTSHPPTQQMVDAAIRELKERGGSSLSAIKKYINSSYNCDAQKLAPFIKKYLKSAVASGKLVQTKGKGASGSFKLPVVSSGGVRKNKLSKVQSKVKTGEKKVRATKKSSNVVTSGGKKVDGKAKSKASPKKALSVAKKPKSSVAVKSSVERKKTEKAKLKTIKKSGGSALKSKPVKANLKSPKALDKKKPKKIVAAPAKKTSKKATKN